MKTSLTKSEYIEFIAYLEQLIYHYYHYEGVDRQVVKDLRRLISRLKVIVGLME